MVSPFDCCTKVTKMIKKHLKLAYSESRHFINARTLPVVKKVIPKSIYADVHSQITMGVVKKITTPSRLQLRSNFCLR